ncbi:hypothetical protein GQ55_9G189600 [Panicum hallii var. hallii]|uniref:Uncharacterized protein n=1 Tax=Panicum hallii var. hallii TaxID=1504633 RepID=A0A2T7C4T4_9POAL|nr:hypothetical protein GQ55_9G189600 [Panicum hallii var. hallii]
MAIDHLEISQTHRIVVRQLHQELGTHDVHAGKLSDKGQERSTQACQLIKKRS